MRAGTVLVIIGMILMLGPWVWALASLAIDPESGRDGGVISGAFFLTLLAFPPGAILALIGLARRRA